MNWLDNALDLGALPKAVDKIASNVMNAFQANMGGGNFGGGGGSSPVNGRRTDKGTIRNYTA